MKHMATIDKIRDWLDAYASHLPLTAQLQLIEIVTEDATPASPHVLAGESPSKDEGEAA